MKIDRRLNWILIAVAAALLILPGNGLAVVRPLRQTDEQPVKIPAEQLDSLVAPIALVVAEGGK